MRCDCEAWRVCWATRAATPQRFTASQSRPLPLPRPHLRPPRRRPLTTSSFSTTAPSHSMLISHSRCCHLLPDAFHRLRPRPRPLQLPLRRQANPTFPCTGWRSRACNRGFRKTRCRPLVCLRRAAQSCVRVLYGRPHRSQSERLVSVWFLFQFFFENKFSLRRLPFHSTPLISTRVLR